MTRRQQKSIRYYTDDLPEISHNFYNGMFVDDVADGIMPIGGNAHGREFSVQLVPADDDFEQVLINGLTTHDTQESLAAALSELFRLVAIEVCTRDVVAYEIVYHDATDGTVEAFDLAYISGSKLTFRGKHVRQELPAEYASTHGFPTVIELDRSEVMLFHAPADLQRTIRQTRESLSQLDDDRTTALVLEAQQGGLPYDFSVHNSALNVALADVLKSTGWTARGSFNQEVLSYYLVYMHLAFERFKLRLREAFLEQLNQGLREIGKAIPSSSQIAMSGLPTAAEIDAALAKLEAGNVAFTALMQPFLRY